MKLRGSVVSGALYSPAEIELVSRERDTVWLSGAVLRIYISASIDLE